MKISDKLKSRNAATLIGPKEHDVVGGSWRERRMKSAFTLIEMIVVIAVIGILVLLAAPKFLGYSDKARTAQITNDIKVLETKIDEYLINHEKFPDTFTDGTPGDGHLYDRTGKIESAPGDLKVVDGTFYPETNLGGHFYTDKDGNVIYEDDKNPNVNNDEIPPLNTAYLSDVRRISAGEYHSLLLMNDGTVKTWGSNEDGELGLGDNVPRITPVTIPNLTDVSEVLAGFYTSLALMNDGTVKAWGANRRLVPQTIPDLANVKKLAGYYAKYALLNDGTVRRFYDSSANATITPTVMPNLAGVKDLSIGTDHAFALLENGTVMAWGDNFSYQLGLGNNVNKSTPVVVPGLTDVKQIVAGQYYSLALMNDGTVKSWGNNWKGELGHGDLIRKTEPTTIDGLNGVERIEVNHHNVYALMSDGTFKAWGKNTNGQLGVGIYDMYNDTLTRPTDIPDFRGVVQLAAGNYFSLAMMHDGSVMGWGDNLMGWLGDNVSENRIIPTLVKDLNIND